MIKSLYLKNFALFKETLVEFENGLNIVTGETGSGKSLLLKSLKFLSGDRFSKDYIRDNTNRCVLEVDYQYEKESIIIRRVFHSDGKSRTFLNDEPISIDKLKEISQSLLDYHGQHENQKLFKPQEQLLIIDQFAGITDNVSELNQIYSSMSELEKEIISLEKEKQRFLREQEIIDFQLSEISQIEFELQEDFELTKKIKKKSHQADINNKLEDSIKILKFSIFEKLNNVRKNIDYISSLDDEFNSFIDRLDEVYCELEDISFDIEKNSNKHIPNQSEIQEMNEKLSVLEMLKRKYGGSLEAVLEYQNEIIEKIQKDSKINEYLSKLKKDKLSLEKKYQTLSKKISKKRNEIAPKLIPQIENNLSQLGMDDTKFQIEIVTLNEQEYFPFGNNKCEFKIAPNKSGELKLLNKIASGGELSRIQLALKMLKLSNTQKETIVFDEIDTGISGKIADMTGKVMQEISNNQQVICITHLPQIAGKGDFHFVPSKINDGDEVRVNVKKITDLEKIEEIALLISGNKITQTSKERAKEILKVH
jgi:DNA repair protein RecN (Recombination protein N)